MALIRLTGHHDTSALPPREEELILNTAHIMLAYADTQDPPRGSMVQLANGDLVLVRMSFDDLWQLIQRET